MTVVFTSPMSVFARDAFGAIWLPARLHEIRNGVALVQLGDYWTVRPLDEVRSRVTPTKPLETRKALRRSD
jgi:hypothetical protein